MTLQVIEPLAYPDFRSPIIAGADQGIAIDAADEAGGIIMQASQTDSITHVRFQLRTFTTGSTLEVRIETVSGGEPSGTLWDTDTEGTVAVTATGAYEVTLTAPASVTQGDFFAVVIKQPSSSPGNCALMCMAITGNIGMPRTLQYVSSWSFNRSITLSIQVLYDSGEKQTVLGAGLFAGDTALTINSGTTPDERGNKFVLPMTCRVFGVVMKTGAATGDLVFTLYDQSDVVLLTKTIPGALVDVANQVPHQFRFDESIELTAGLTYRVTYQSSNTSNVIGFQTSLSEAGDLDAWVTDGIVESTWRTDEGEWSDSDLGLVWLGLLIDAIDTGSGAGGGGGRIIGSGI